ncbi:hypothetical protein QKC54_gp0796 [Megavirus baoshan]|uniref:Uncharacterized protein n=1 Tax=Megavirus baoshan TaxID=2496520 RepID=A0A3Q8U8V2_9VIRU|nr:hypothetical protein QKC54_gp0796 [Megavirus baoshan]AZL89909.1 hypothetical protein Mb0276 [Megavirus baoshan]
MNLPEYNINNFYPHEKAIICGKRLTGKTTLVNKLIENICDNRQIQHLYLIVSNKSLNQFNITNHSKLQNKTTHYFNINKFIIKTINSECNKNDGEKIIVVDDIIISSNILKDLIKIEATIIMSCQYFVYYYTSLFNTFIFTQENSIINKQNIYNLAQKSFVGHKHMSNFDNFKKLFDHNTSNYNAMVISKFKLLRINTKFFYSKNKSLNKDYISEPVNNIFNKITKPKFNTPIEIII